MTQIIALEAYLPDRDNEPERVECVHQWWRWSYTVEDGWRREDWACRLCGLHKTKVMQEYLDPDPFEEF